MRSCQAGAQHPSSCLAPPSTDRHPGIPASGLHHGSIVTRQQSGPWDPVAGNTGPAWPSLVANAQQPIRSQLDAICFQGDAGATSTSSSSHPLPLPPNRRDLTVPCPCDSIMSQQLCTPAARPWPCQCEKMPPALVSTPVQTPTPLLV